MASSSDLHEGRGGRSQTQSEDCCGEFHGVLLWTNEDYSVGILCMLRDAYATSYCAAKVRKTIPKSRQMCSCNSSSRIIFLVLHTVQDLHERNYRENPGLALLVISGQQNFVCINFTHPRSCNGSIDNVVAFRRGHQRYDWLTTAFFLLSHRWPRRALMSGFFLRASR